MLKKYLMGISQCGIPIFLLAIILLTTSCEQKNNRQITRGIYYWKTNVKITEYEQERIDDLAVEEVYVKFFDVDIAADGKNITPVAIVNFSENIPKQDIIPVVFITPRALNTLDRATIEDFVENVASLIAHKAKDIDLDPQEIQMDCDWTRSNKDLYFSFLRKLKNHPFFKDKILSVTIRLHQIKYAAESGIPPVDKGLLMVYNMESLTDINIKNSIISTVVAKDYLTSVSQYPLPLDVALPIFSWSLLFEKNQLLGILREVSDKDINGNKSLYLLEDNLYKVTENTTLKNYDLKKDQIIRFENSDIKVVQQVAQFLSKEMKNDSMKVLLYHCDSLQLQNYTTYELDKIYTHFH
ncbi:MAG TPA: hypothetical protein VFD78_00635 [Chitinophagaceae bacterium]|nr:hypothetical protein [Chitinophagaceae bacterium]